MKKQPVTITYDPSNHPAWSHPERDQHDVDESHEISIHPMKFCKFSSCWYPRVCMFIFTYSPNPPILEETPPKPQLIPARYMGYVPAMSIRHFPNNDGFPYLWMPDICCKSIDLSYFYNWELECKHKKDREPSDHPNHPFIRSSEPLVPEAMQSQPFNPKPTCLSTTCLHRPSHTMIAFRKSIWARHLQ